MRFNVTVLGSNSAVPAHGRFPSAQVVNVHEHLYLVDCGEGTQMRMSDHGIKRSRIEQIFISHMHGDHIFGLAGLLNTYSLMGRRQALDIFAPRGLEDLVTLQLEVTQSVLAYELRIHETDPKKHTKIFEDEAVKVYSIPLRHRIPACGFLFVEKRQAIHMRPEKIIEYNIPVTEIGHILAGKDWKSADGTIIPNADLTIPAKPPRSYAYCSDTAFFEGLAPFVKDVDLLYHEATFMDDMADNAVQTGHSTARQAATLANLAGAKKLMLGHYSSRYKDLQPLLTEAQAVFANTCLSLDGLTIDV